MSSFKEKFSQFFERKADNAVERINHTPTNKLILIVLVLFSVGTVAIGALQVKAFLDKPFFADKLIEEKGKIRGPIGMLDYIREQRQTNEAITKMQQRDTDGDGLNDYDEVYVYHTNPYTQFTNGGDKSDKQIVESGEWKSGCVGANCNTNTTVTPTTVTNTNAIAPTTDTNTNIAGSATTDLSTQILAGGQLGQLNETQKAELRNYFQNISVQDLRLMLVSQGFEQAKIDSLSDADIQQTLNGLLEGLK